MPQLTQPRARRGGKRGAIYARFSTKFQASIEDQVRACREWCDANGIEVDESMIFTDRAVSGKKSRRDGMNRLKEALNAGKIDVLVAFMTNRLHRSGYRARAFIEEEVLDNNARCVCIRSGVDTADERRWRLLHGMNAMADEMMLGGTADAVRNAHTGALLDKLIAGRLPYGYTGKELPGRLTRMQRPKREVVIDADTSAWVTRIFDWYLNQDQSITAIVARLSNEGAPRPVGVAAWAEPVVRRILGNRRYTGNWEYGRTRTRWLNKRDYGLQERQEQPLGQKYFPELRIVTDDVFHKTQAKLAARNHRAGRKTKDGRRRPRVLNGLLWCGLHERPLSRGAQFYCPACRRASDAGRLYSALPANVALDVLCATLAKLIREDDRLVPQVVEAFGREAEAQQRPDASALPELRHRKEKLTKSIGLLQRNPGDTDEDLKQTEQSLREMRAERAAVDAEIVKLETLLNHPVRVPSAPEVRAELDQLGAALRSGADASATPGDAAALRDVIELLTGGKIYCRQQGPAKPKQGWARGSFELRLVRSVVSRMGGGVRSEVGVPGEPRFVHIDFRSTTEAERFADAVKAAYDRDTPLKLIAGQLNKPYRLIAAALDHWFTSRGLEREDGRSRRSRLEVKHLETPLYQKICDEVKTLADQGLLFQQIARRLNADRNTITASWKYWHRQHCLMAPAGQQRRKTLEHKTERPYPPRRRGGDDKPADHQQDVSHRPAA